MVGVMEVFHRSKMDPPPEWMNFLETLAGQAAIAIDHLQLFHDLERSNFDLIRAYNEVIEGWAKALELRDQETEGHSRQVEQLTLDIARRMGMQGEQLAHIRQGALLHDIGKMGIPDQILHKPGKLSEAEWEVMRKHPTFAYELLSPIDHLKPALAIPYSHHEKWDGSGYPRGLKGTEIPLEARIFAVVDVWDALRSDRPYRDAWSDERALEYIKDQSGEHFDPRAVDVFLDAIDQEQ
ncbi:MAG: HD domain-containing phosphohydrolase [Anaerolineales bacterium]|nr:HD domain-containing phosphohydrolase [Anaerolineales bacterium]